MLEIGKHVDMANQTAGILGVLLRNRVDTAIRNYKSEFIKEELHRHRSNPKQLWASLREISPKCNSSGINSLFDEDTNRIIHRDELPGYINTYFAEIGKKIWQNLF